MKAKGFPGQRGVISQWAQRRRLVEKANGLARTPSARGIARLMTTARDDLAQSEAIHWRLPIHDPLEDCA
ncbi:hypothetical protein ATN84_25540 [Paramesorhizobium deserti]|uniref:Transposase n=1 Tax=Paramesorhizobium deserti TaxID=1494590 RepID=A0A135HVE6_9HYPH|nr:hypothetical protein ATN84_25540 [Paramesorhizobium deserti]